MKRRDFLVSTSVVAAALYNRVLGPDERDAVAADLLSAGPDIPVRDGLVLWYHPAGVIVGGGGSGGNPGAHGIGAGGGAPPAIVRILDESGA